MDSFSILLSIFLILNTIALVISTETECPTFPCLGSVPGMMSRPKDRAKSYYLRKQSHITCDYCEELCQKKNCSYWTHGENKKEDLTVCYLFDKSICEPYKYKGETVLPYYPYTPVENWNFQSGKVHHCKGSVEGDPHFSGADNSHYDFTGEPGNNYCLLSDSHIHINGYFNGRYDIWGDNPHKPLTWIRQIGILWGHHTIKFVAREGAEWRYGHGFMQHMEVDGEAFTLGQEGDEARFLGGKVAVKWVSAKSNDGGNDDVDVYELNVDSVLRMRMILRPEIAMFRTDLDGVVHFNIEIQKVTLSSKVHGVLGQTYRPDHLDRLGKQELVHSNLLNLDVVQGENAEGFLDGKVEDYLASSLLVGDCKFSRFTRAETLDTETSQAIELTKGKASDFVSRKLLSLF